MKTLITERHDPVRHPAHYTMYPVESISICRHLGFCLGNVTKYTLRAPWKGGVEDCDKAIEYLRWESEEPQTSIDTDTRIAVDSLCDVLIEYLNTQEGDPLWVDIASAQKNFVVNFDSYVLNIGLPPLYAPYHMEGMEKAVRELKRILTLRDTTGQIYDGMTGRPYTQEAE